MVRYFQSPWVLEGDAGRVFGDLDGCLGMLTRRRSAPAKFDACRRQRISNPASEVIAEPRNWSIRRRSKSSLSAAPPASPVGSAIAAPHAAPDALAGELGEEAFDGIELAGIIHRGWRA